MAASSTFTWNNASGGNWSSSGNWTLFSGSGTFSYNTAAAEQEAFILGAQTGAYVVTIDQSTVLTGSVDTTSANVTIAVGANKFETAAAAVETYKIGTLTMSAGEVTLAGGTLAFYDYSLGSGGAGNSGEIFGYGKLGNISTTSGYTSTLTTVSGSSGKIVADGGTLDVSGTGTAAYNVLNASGTFLIDSAATLKFDTDTALVSGSTVNFQDYTGTGGVGGVLYTTGQNSGNNAQFSGTGTPYTFNATVQNMAIGATQNSSVGASEITLGSLAISGASLNTSTGVLSVDVGANVYNFNTSGDTYTTLDQAFYSGSNVWIDVTCFAAGTRILTGRGEIAVEDLIEGDPIVLADGGVSPAKWLGHLRIDISRHPKPELVAPVRILRDAFGQGAPSRDLLVSPDHCLFVDGKLIPAKLLLNDMTIRQDRTIPVVTYYHVELDRHAVILAEGLPAESYLDTGNRANFSNAGVAMVLHPDFEVNASLKCWETDACAPLSVRQDEVQPIWETLAARAESLGYNRPEVATTTDPELRVVVDGRTLRPLSHDGDRYVFTLPASAGSIRLTSRVSVPAETAAYLGDWRRLGVAVRRIVVRDSNGLIEMPPDHPGLTQGWHQVEHNANTMWRWMDGNAVLPIAPTEGPTLLEVHVAGAMRYAVKNNAEIRRAA